MSSNDQIVNDPTKEESKLHKTVHQLAWGLTVFANITFLAFINLLLLNSK